MPDSEGGLLGARARSASDAAVLRRKGHLKEQDPLIEFLLAMHATHTSAEAMAKMERWVAEHRQARALRAPCSYPHPSAGPPPSASDAAVLRRKGHLKEQDPLIEFLLAMHATHTSAEAMAKMERWIAEHRQARMRSCRYCLALGSSILYPTG